MHHAHEAGQQTKQRLAAQKQQTREMEQEQMNMALQMTAAELAEARRENELTAKQLETIKAEKQAAQDEIEELKKMASVERDAENTVITIPGEVLFASGESELRGGAKDKLQQVAKVLKRKEQSAKLTVLGHSDSRGDAAYNEKLSRMRAESVRQYLLTQGLQGEPIEAEGMGETQPVASNDSASGRASNRRVEIVVHGNVPGTGTARAGSSEDAGASGAS